MNILKLATLPGLFLLSATAGANTGLQTISVIANDKEVASFEIPASTRIEISAEHQTLSTDQTRSDYKGNARLTLTPQSGESITVKADELRMIVAK